MKKLSLVFLVFIAGLLCILSASAIRYTPVEVPSPAPSGSFECDERCSVDPGSNELCQHFCEKICGISKHSPIVSENVSGLAIEINYLRCFYTSRL
ncbi:hypothetical protein LXL04_013592 [Taraxacum kok-saghyz]